MAFDWLLFLEANHIHFVTTGPNVSHGHVAVHCPFCGHADPSQHMAISMSGGGWKCWRNAGHRGKAPSYLVAALLNIGTEAARQMVDGAVFIPDDFMGTVRAKLAPPVAPAHVAPLRMPKEFGPITNDRNCRRAVDYLRARDFTPREVAMMTDVYRLRYATTGDYKHRIVFPIYAGGKLMTYTARSVYPDATLRYKTLSANPERETIPAVGPINDYLLWQDDILANPDRADTILFSEGPFDALKLRCIGVDMGVEATAFFTSSPSRLQLELIHEIAPRYKRRFLLLDQSTLGNAMRAQRDLAALKVGVLMLPDHIKDPGEMQENDLKKILLAAP